MLLLLLLLPPLQPLLFVVVLVDGHLFCTSKNIENKIMKKMLRVEGQDFFVTMIYVNYNAIQKGTGQVTY